MKTSKRDEEGGCRVELDQPERGTKFQRSSECSDGGLEEDVRFRRGRRGERGKG